MPVWEGYEIEVKTVTSIMCKGQVIAEYTTYGKATGTSNEDVGRPDIREAVAKATEAAKHDAYRIAQAVRLNRRKQIGYTDGD